MVSAQRNAKFTAQIIESAPPDVRMIANTTVSASTYQEIFVKATAPALLNVRIIAQMTISPHLLRNRCKNIDIWSYMWWIVMKPAVSASADQQLLVNRNGICAIMPESKWKTVSALGYWGVANNEICTRMLREQRKPKTMTALTSYRIIVETMIFASGPPWGLPLHKVSTTQNELSSGNVPTQLCHTAFYTRCAAVTLSIKYNTVYIYTYIYIYKYILLPLLRPVGAPTIGACGGHVTSLLCFRSKALPWVCLVFWSLQDGHRQGNQLQKQLNPHWANRKGQCGVAVVEVDWTWSCDEHEF